MYCAVINHRLNLIKYFSADLLRKQFRFVYDFIIITILRIIYPKQIIVVHHRYVNLVVELASGRILRFDRKLGLQINKEWDLICFFRENNSEKEFHLPGALKIKLAGLSYISMPKYCISDNFQMTLTMMEEYFDNQGSNSITGPQSFDSRYIESAYKKFEKIFRLENIIIPSDWHWESFNEDGNLKLRSSHGDLNIGNVFVHENGKSLIFIDLDCMNPKGIREFDFIDYSLSLQPSIGWIEQLGNLIKEGQCGSLFRQKISTKKSHELIYFYLLQRIGQDFLKFGNRNYFRNPKNVINVVKLLLVRGF
jgi:hypothetical protein